MTAPLQLTRPHDEVRKAIEEQLERGGALLGLAKQVGGEGSAGSWWNDYERWRAYVAELLKRLYTTDEPRDEFMRKARRPSAIGDWRRKHQSRIDTLAAALNVLDSLVERLGLLDAEASTAAAGVSESVKRDRESDGDEPPRFISGASHTWALQNREFLNVVFEWFDREGNWPPLSAMQRRLIREGKRTNITQLAYALPRELGYRESPPDERVVLSIFALRYVDGAAELLDDFIRVFRLAVERYQSTDDPVTVTRADLTETLGLSNERATKLSRILVRGTRFLSGGHTDLDSWEMSVYEPGVVAAYEANTIDEYLAADAEQLGLMRAMMHAAPGAGLDSSVVDVSKPVFLVHGHDDAAKYKVARFLERVTTPGVTILDEQPGRGRTLIKKFEDYAGAAGYAVVLLTGDDEGREKGEDEWAPRARQNVILELGFFVAKLGRGHVAILYEANVERPSDIEGVVYVPFDSSDAWKTKLAREMRDAGISIDPDKALTA